MSKVEKDKDELNQLVSFSKDRADKLLIDKESWGSDLVTFGVEWDSLKELLTAKEKA